MQSFARIDRLPPYVFAIVDELKLKPAALVRTSLILAWAIPMRRPRSR